MPAHDEAALVGRCISTLVQQDYPRSLFRIVVIADNCTDDTAAIARQHGALVLERFDPDRRGKGHALKWALRDLMESDASIDAFVVVDADSIAGPGLLSALASGAESGAKAVQADYGALVEGGSDRAQLRVAAFMLFHRVRFAGKARLGLPCSLVGNGMLFTRSLLLEHPWSAFSEVEDLEYSVQLRLAGIGPAFAPEGRLVAPVASMGAAAEVQRGRWEVGRMRVVRRYLPAVIRQIVAGRRADLWDVAVDLALPPLGVLSTGILAGTGSAALLAVRGRVAGSALVPWLVATLALPAHVLLGLRAGEAPPAVFRALRSAPRLILAESVTRVRALKPRAPEDRWIRTPRPDTGDHGSPPCGRAHIGPSSAGHAPCPTGSESV